MSASQVPAGWTVEVLDDLRAPGEFTLVGGPFGSDLTAKDYISEPGVPVIRGANLGGTDGRFVDDGFVFVSEQKAGALRRNLAFPGDLVFTQRGTLGQVAIIPESARFGRYVISQSQMKLNPNPAKVDREFLYRYFRTPSALRQLLGQTQATGVPHINLGILKRFPVLLPSLPEQKRIARVLNQADALRVRRRAAIGELDALAKAVFLDMFGDPTTNPLDWPRLSLSDVLAIPLRNGKSPSRTGTIQSKVLTLSAITGAEFDARAWKTDLFSDHPRAEHTVDPRDLLICRGNGSLERVGRGFFPSEAMPDIAFPDTMVAARIAVDRIAPQFLQAVWNSGAVRRQVESMARTTNGTYKVNQGVLEGISFIAPPHEMQVEFASRALALTHAKSIQTAARRTLDALFDSLQHRLFAGQPLR